MLKQIELAAHIRLPPFPPPLLPSIFFAINILVSFYCKDPTTFRLFAFIFGSLMMYRIRTVQFYFKCTVIINSIPLWSFMKGQEFEQLQEKFVLAAIFLLYSKILIFSSIGVFQALFFIKKVQFDDVYWVVQMGTLAEYCYSFTGIKFLKTFPNLLRIIQNLRVFNQSAIISALRFVFRIVKDLAATKSTQWYILSIIISFWQNYNNYVNQFKINRIFAKGKQICIYPPAFIFLGFGFIVLSQWGWLWTPEYAPILTTVSKILWNFLRLQSRISDLLKKYTLYEIVNLKHSEDLHNIIY